MMEERWRRQIRVEPDSVTAQASADRARKRALARFGQTTRSRSLLGWPAVTIAAGFTFILWVTTLVAPLQRPPAAPDAQPTRVQFVLSDGTKVQWVFSDRFAL
jgi:ferric-dicitrate binding protein FerR (iron transport regulator)